MKKKKWNKSRRAFLAFLLPSFLGVVFFVLLPFLDVFKRSFTTAVTGEFVGIQNYVTVYENRAFRLAVGNTLRFTLVCLPLLLVLGLLEAGRIDGAGEWYLFWRIGLPLSSGGILSAMVLGFLEYWNLIEQPLAFLKDKALWPLSLYLPEIGQDKAGFAFAASVVTLVPSVFVFLLGRDYLEKGIVASGLKE